MIKDWSSEHRPAGVLFDSADVAKMLKRYRIAEEDIRFFHENGYLKGVRILDDEQVEILRSELARLMKADNEDLSLFYEYNSNESADPNLTLFHALGAWRVSPAFHDLLWHPAFTVPASQLLGGSVRFWHDQLFCKPARHGGVVAWHQDYSYWTRTKPISHLTCWIALDDVSEENGCLQYVPGSHRWPLLPITGIAGDMNAIQTVLSDEQKKQFKPAAVELKKGECSFHHPLLVHGSYENSTTGPRRAAVLNVMRDGVCSGSTDELLAGVPPIAPGEKMEGRFFPMLYAG